MNNTTGYKIIIFSVVHLFLPSAREMGDHGRVIEITSPEEFQRQVNGAQGLVVIDWSAKWFV